jgi:penicillin amidase
MRVVEETIAVKGRAPERVALKFTRHGPVLFEDHARHRAYALRAAWMEIGSAPYLASLRMNQAASWEEFREACTRSRIPSENMVWADSGGTIGYQAAGIAPRRPLRVERLPADHGAAARREPGARLRRDRQPLPVPGGLSAS